MEKSINVYTDSHPPQHEQIGFLDILVMLAENFKLLIFMPLLVGVLALSLSFALPKTFESVAKLNANQTIASLMTTTTVLNLVAAELGFKDELHEEAGRQLREQIKVVVGRTDQLITLTVSAPTPQQAQTIAEAVLQKTYVQSRPKASELTRFKTQLKDAQVRIKNAEDAAGTLLKRMDSNGAGNSGMESARGYAELLNVAAAAQTQVLTLEEKIEGVTGAQLIQAPTLPQKASKPRKALLAIGATVVTGVLVLLFIFLREALRNTVEDTVSASKVARIRQALALR